MKRAITKSWGLAILAAGAATLAACLPDRAGWSPDGRELRLIRPEDGALVAWDSQTKRSREIFRDPFAKTVFCFPAGSSGAIFFATERKGPDPQHPIHDLNWISPDGKIRKDLAKDVSIEAGMASSADGAKSYFFRDLRESGGKAEMWIAESAAGGAEPKTRMLLAQAGALGYPSASKDGSKLVLTFENGIGVYDAERGTTNMLIRGKESIPVLYGVWALDETEIAYVDCVPKKDDPKASSWGGTLSAFNVKSGQTRRLAGGVPILRRPMLGPGGAIAYVTQAVDAKIGEPVEGDEIAQSKIQIAAFDLKTGARTIVTHEPDGAFFPYPDPAGKRVAYGAQRPGAKGGDQEELVWKICDAGGGEGAPIDTATKP